jgi:hypothetical protein
VRKKRVLGPNKSILTPYFPLTWTNNLIEFNNIAERKPKKIPDPLPQGEYNFAIYSYFVRFFASPKTTAKHNRAAVSTIASSNLTTHRQPSRPNQAQASNPVHYTQLALVILT